MKANKRVRDPKRRSKYALIVIGKDGVKRGVTTQPTLTNSVQRMSR